MFKIKRFMTFFGAVMLLLLTSCSFNNEKKSGSVVFDFTKLGENPQANSRITVQEYFSQYENCYLDLKFEGTFEFAETYDLKETPTIVINDIPVGAQIKAVLEIYSKFIREDNNEEIKEIIFTGESETCTIQDGPNQITVPLKVYSDEPEPQPQPEEPKITIYVEYDENHTTMQYWETDEPAANDGTEDNPFNYIMSAFKWISNNGNADENYEILLTGYEENPFNQFIEITSSLNSHAKSIIFTSEDPETIAIKCSYAPFMEIQNQSSYNVVPIIFKNIQIATTHNNESNSTSTIICPKNEGSGYINCYCDITFGQGTVISGNDEVNCTDGGAIHLRCGNITMEGNATIKNFKARDKGGAVFIDNGSFTMKGNSRIENCEVTQASDLSKGEGGGAFCIANAISTVTLEENASIVSCKAKYGGAVFIHRGCFDMYSGLIMECSAPSGYGGAIYMNTKSGNSTVYLRSGKINNNTASQGAAIYRGKNDGSNTTIVDISDGFEIDLDEIYQES